MRAKRARCEFFQNEQSCFNCPYEDCVWSPKDGMMQSEVDKLEQYRERLQDAESMVEKMRLLGDTKAVRKYRSRANYCKRCIAKLELENSDE